MEQESEPLPVKFGVLVLSHRDNLIGSKAPVIDRLVQLRAVRCLRRMVAQAFRPVPIG